jgi:hypothetical protein
MSPLLWRTELRARDSSNYRTGQRTEPQASGIAQAEHDVAGNIELAGPPLRRTCTAEQHELVADEQMLDERKIGDGGFPWAAVPGPIGPPKLPFKVEKNEFLVATSETSPKPLGFVSDAVRFRKVARFA